jgi:hypothetical protein
MSSADGSALTTTEAGIEDLVSRAVVDLVLTGARQAASTTR